MANEPSILHPLLAAIVEDHGKHKEARALGRALADKTSAALRADHAAKVANIEAVKRLSAQLPPLCASPAMTLADGLNFISRLADPHA